MSNIWKATVAVTAVVATAALSAPARAEFSVSFGSGGISFTYESGGYCDRWGCPDGYWDYPIYDCPIFFEGQWYDGPMYYRWYRGERWYWIRGRWHRDQWRGQRPDGMCYDEFRPALGFEFYERNGFRIRQDWRRRWHHDHDRDGGRAFDNWWNQGGRYHDWRGNDNNGRDNWFNWQGNEHRLNDWRGYDDRDRNWRGNRRHRDEGGQQFFQGGNQGGQGGNNNQGQWKQQFFQGGQGGGNQGGGNQGGQNKPNKFQGGQQFLQGGGNQGGGNQGGQNKPNKFQGGQQFFQGGQGGGNQGGGNQGG
ncbi:MAG: hypothetical protein KGJ78_09930, partial [Alphaproteobacteria bacterium]|nr:hypothetical protein [Alphaproteobacteria bacterium]